jgi:hypothetical protein
MIKRKPVVWVGTLPLLLGGFLVSSPAAFATNVSDSEPVTKLLFEAKTQANQLKEDAATMESFNRMNVSRETQAVTINLIRDHINALGRTEAKLKDAENAAAPWQKQVINRVVPFLDELDGYTNAVIEHLNGEQRHNFAEYKDYLEANADYSGDLAKMISDFVDYGRTKDRLQDLTEKLEIRGGK